LPISQSQRAILLRNVLTGKERRLRELYEVPVGLRVSGNSTGELREPPSTRYKHRTHHESSKQQGQQQTASTHHCSAV
jgi:hypothetical protein